MSRNEMDMEFFTNRKRRASNEEVSDDLETKKRSPSETSDTGEELFSMYHTQACFTKNGCERYYGTKLEYELLNGYLDMFIPHAFVRHNALDRIISELSNKHDLIPGAQSVRILTTGSLVQGLSLPTYSIERGDIVEFFGPDFDLFQMNLNVMEKFEGSEIPRYELEQFDEGAPNYVHLVQNGTPTENDAWYIDETNLRTPVRNTAITHEFLLRQSGQFHSKLGQLEDIGISGPAFSFMSPNLTPLNTALTKCYFPEDRLKVDKGDVDFCYGVGFDGWPDVAENFIQRDRPSGWPDQKLISLATSRGYGVTPVGRNHSSTKEYEWRYSFADAERVLANHISNRQRTVFILVKLLHTFFFKQPTLLKTYGLKTLLFWLCERIPRHAWEGSNAQMIRIFLDEIIHCLATGHLDDYFIKGANLLAGTLSCFRKTLGQRVMWVKQHQFAAFRIVESQIEFHNEIQFPYGDETLVKYFVITPHDKLQKNLVREVLSDAYFDFIVGLVIDLTNLYEEQSGHCNEVQRWGSVASINTALVILVEMFRKFLWVSSNNKDQGNTLAGLVLCIESTLNNEIRDVSASFRANVLCMVYYMILNGNEESMFSSLNYDTLLNDVTLDSLQDSSPSGFLQAERQDEEADSKPVKSEMSGSFQHCCYPYQIEHGTSPSGWLRDIIRQCNLNIKDFESVLTCMEDFNNHDYRKLDNRYVLTQYWECVEKILKERIDEDAI